jgi:hypothetical protein
MSGLKPMRSKDDVRQLQSREHFSKMKEEESSLGNTKKFPISAMGFSRIRKKRFQRIQDF